MTLYPCFRTEEAGKFKLCPRKSAENHPAYSYGIVHSRKVVLRSFVTMSDFSHKYPFNINVLTCAAVNAGEVHKAISMPVCSGLEVGIAKEMTERMGKILFVFEQEGVRNIVMGTLWDRRILQ